VSTKRYEVLVVDDDPVIRDMMVDILSFEGYVIHTARNGREALEKIHQTDSAVRYVVFLDLLMPVIDGYTVCRQLNEDTAIRQRHTIILMSALDNIIEASSLKVDATLPKPFSVDEVIRVIDPFMG